MKSRKKIIFSLFLFLLVCVPVGATQAANSWNPAELDLMFVNAYYADLDGDGIEDDVLLDIYVEFLSFTFFDSVFGKKMDLYVELELPSGQYFDYGFEITAYQPIFNFVLEGYDHATESGDYTAHALGICHDNVYGLYTYLVFDPPGAGKPVPPSISFYCY